jgi:hypothetical protein
VLVGRDGVHVALYDDHAFLPGGFLGQVGRVEDAGLVEYWAARRVKVLGYRVAQRPAAESRQAAVPVVDGEYEPSPKEVPVSSVLALGDQTGQG